MELLRGRSSLRAKIRPSVATIGAFDGVHLGHQTVISQLAEQGRKFDLPTTVVTFEPLPREYLAADSAPARLQSFRERFESLAALGVDRLLCLRFNETLRQMSAEEFAENIFVEGLGVRALVLGDDFRFGHDREGGFSLMESIGKREGFDTLATETIEVEGERVSSTRLRTALAAGDFATARACLGRDYEISGRVVYGRQLGRQIGSPTANIALRRRSVPLSGVFAVTVSGGGLDDAPAIASVGVRPTVEEGLKPNLEVHILDGDHTLYGQRISVRFLHKFREEERYESVEILKAKIHEDIEGARAWFALGTEERRIS
ncbi:bifunctional riboflavin kinase/FAD synthetase [Congregibacter litoralis]|uniref:Riboflavin biosynthesis protein n=1 Tax=Congregibacter litoralis KT71 TaxID=314285 RepID=A4ADV3_9GAMM|nr:bifunctional riboflavin kinase/FAD synthetase [Congregibacter litoralis]EAQ95835.1 FMN adenylyltransferase/riboflavin kinase [Congregibacter litoralis KT71]